MSWWGKLLGGAFGFMLGGPIGALLGAALGHRFDAGLGAMRGMPGGGFDPGATERIQTAFFTTTFSVMGHLAKADGQVTRDEVEMARAVMAHMALNDAQTRAAMHLFNAGKQPDFDLDGVLAQFRRECHGRRNLLQMFLEIQMQGMYADGRVHPAEERLLQHVCERLGITRAEYKLIEMRLRAAWQTAGGAGAGAGHRPRRSSADELKAAYAVLGIAPESSDEVVKKTYRRLMNQHHPDKLVSKGLPGEMIKLATERTQEIKAAYELIKKMREA